MFLIELRSSAGAKVAPHGASACVHHHWAERHGDGEHGSLRPERRLTWSRHTRSRAYEDVKGAC